MTRTNRLPITVDRPCIFEPTGNGGWCASPLPEGAMLPGLYRGQVIGTEVAGGVLKVSWRICGGHFDCRVVDQHIRFMHENPKTQRAGLRQIQTITDAVGHSGLIQDSKILHDAKLLIVVRLVNGNEPIVTEARPLGALQ